MRNPSTINSPVLLEVRPMLFLGGRRVARLAPIRIREYGRLVRWVYSVAVGQGLR